MGNVVLRVVRGRIIGHGLGGYNWSRKWDCSGRNVGIGVLFVWVGTRGVV